MFEILIEILNPIG